MEHQTVVEASDQCGEHGSVGPVQAA
jgi:hypothetical protein